MLRRYIRCCMASRGADIAEFPRDKRGLSHGFLLGRIAIFHASVCNRHRNRGRFSVECALSEKSSRLLFSIITLPAALICGAAALYAPGIGLGLWLILMARYQGSLGLLVVSGGFMVLYVIGWYYFLEVILLQKSLLLVSGLVLLGLAWGVKKVLPAQIGGASENA